MCDAMQFMYSRYWLMDLYITPTCGYFCYITPPPTPQGQPNNFMNEDYTLMKENGQW